MSISLCNVPGKRGLIFDMKEMLETRGYIYKAKHEGWYSVSDETFYPQSVVDSALDPMTGRKLMVRLCPSTPRVRTHLTALQVSRETGKEVEWSSEINYHFRLSRFKEKLLQCYQEDLTIRPKVYRDEVVQAVTSDIPDLSISRPVERLEWGIRVPGDESQTIYVWVDALVNYLTKAGYPFPPGEGYKQGWPADVQVIGKDITR
jgi:methionyl-tRNA synthetase